MAKYKVLSLDGGGLRGLITARLLDRLNSDQKIAGWLDSVDMLTSVHLRVVFLRWALRLENRPSIFVTYTRIRARKYLTIVFGTIFEI